MSIFKKKAKPVKLSFTTYAEYDRYREDHPEVSAGATVEINAEPWATGRGWCFQCREHGTPEHPLERIADPSKSDPGRTIPLCHDCARKERRNAKARADRAEKLAALPVRE